ncbi:MAG: sensor histidine kinase N-terminal domain-containing protein [Burkholderiaceae bacterium]
MSANPRPGAITAATQVPAATVSVPEPAVASNEPVAPPLERRSAPRTGPFAQSGPARSLFSEILDWMLAPLLLVWPMSVGFTFLVAQGLSNGPFDRALGDSVLAVAEQVRETDTGVRLNLPSAARDILRSDELDVITYQVIGHEGELLVGDRDMPAPLAYEVIAPGAVRFRDDRVRGIDVRVAYLWLEGALTGNQRPVLIQVAETLEKRTRLANEIIKGVILPQFVVLPIAVLLVWFGLTRGIAPLRICPPSCGRARKTTSRRSICAMRRKKCTCSCARSMSCWNGWRRTSPPSAALSPTPRISSKRRWRACACRRSWHCAKAAAMKSNARCSKLPAAASKPHGLPTN